MELRTLKYFSVIVEEQTIAKASIKLNIAQPALSIELKKLEQELGVLLFERKNRGLSITREGRILYQQALKILQMSSSIKEDLTTEFKNIIRLGVMSSASAIYSSEILKNFMKDNKNVSFDIVEDSTYELLGHLMNNDIELAFVRTPFNNFNLESVTFPEEDMVAIGKKEFFSNSSMNISLKELSQKPLIYYKRYQMLFEEAFSKSDLKLDFVCRCEDAKTATMWANAGHGVAMLPQSAAPLASKELLVKIIDSKILKTTPMIVYKSYEGLSPFAKRLVDAYKMNTKLL